MNMPHCDSSVLHAPGVCQYCDGHSEWQQYRRAARINFTGENDKDKAPCPSTFFRSLETLEQWGGNVPAPTEEKVMEDFDRIKKQLEQGGF